MMAMAPVVPYARPPIWTGSESVTPHRAARPRLFRGLIVDLDDTLYPRRRFVQSGFAAVAAHVGLRYGIPPDDAYSLLTDTLSRGESKVAFQILCGRFNLPDAVVRELVQVFRSHRPNLFLGAGARTMLRALRADRWRIAVLTNGLPSVQARKVEALGLPALVDAVIFAEDVVAGGKPARAAFAGALRALGTRPDRTVVLGDDPACDIAGGRAAGLATIRLSLPDIAVPAAMDADAVVDMLTEVPHVAASLLEGVTRHVA